MYYEERLINGILMFRHRPEENWQQCSIEKMSQKIIDFKKALTEIANKKDEVYYSQDDYMYSLHDCIEIANKSLS